MQLLCSEVDGRATLLHNFLGSAIFVGLEVFNELSGELLASLVIGSLVSPGVLWHEDGGIVNAISSLWYPEVEAWHHFEFNVGEFAFVDEIEERSGELEAHSLTNTVWATAPASVHEPNIAFVFFTHLSKLFGVGEWMEREESLTEASREGWDGVDDAHFSSSNLSSVTSDEVVHDLLFGQFGNGW